MRPRSFLRASLSVLVLAAAACESGTGPAEPADGPPATLAITTAPDFSGSVSKAEAESANGPAGPYSQHNLWVAVPPSSSANAGVVVPADAPVYVRRGGAVFAFRAGDIRAGDQVEVWRRTTPVSYGAVQGPPGAPTYVGTQIVVVR